MRPLSLVNSFNRIIASVLKNKLEDKANEWICGSQKGFLPNRHMLDNVIEADLAALKVRKDRKKGALILFDFQAAFPSLDHDYMWSILEALRIPPCILNAYKALYEYNPHQIDYFGGQTGMLH